MGSQAVWMGSRAVWTEMMVELTASMVVWMGRRVDSTAWKDVRLKASQC
jgi:hypothetical protein